MFNAYAVSVKLSIVGNVASVLAGLTTAMRRFDGEAKAGQRSLDRFDASAGKLRKTLSEIKALTITGGALAFAGGAVLKGMSGPLAAAMEYEKAATRFKTLNLGDAVNKEADKFARGAQKFGINSTQMMESLRGAYSVFGNMPMASAAAGKIAELNAANANLFGGKIGGAEIQDIKRFIDIRGGTNDVPSFMRQLDLAQKIITGSGGELKFSDLSQFGKIGGTATRSLSDRGLMQLVSMMQEQGGSRAGNMLMSGYQNLISDRTTDRARVAMQDLGLGEMKRINVGSVGGKPMMRNVFEMRKEIKELLAEAPLEAWQKYFIPAIDKSVGPNGTDAQRSQVVNSLLSNRRGSDMGSGIVTQNYQFMRDYKITENAMGADQTIAASKRTMGGSVMNLQARWNSLLTEFGLTVLPLAIKGITALNEALTGVIKWARENPELAAGIMKVAGAFGVLAVAGGGLMLIAGGIKAIALAFGVVKGVGMAAALSGLIGPAGVLALAVTGIYGLGKALDYLFGRTGGQKLEPSKDFQPPGYTKPYNKAEHEQQMRDQLSAFRNGGSVVPPPPASVTGGSGQVKLVLKDGRVLAEVVNAEQSAFLRRAPAGTGRFDPSMSPLSPSMSLTGGF